jgi:Rieske Fe-S protein
MQSVAHPEDPDRRALMQGAACVAGAWAAAGALPAVAGTPRDFAPALLVDERGDPFRAAALKPGEAWLFNYPFAASPVFLLRLDRPVKPAELQTEDQARYTSPAGVGPQSAIVAFSAICSHHLMYPTPTISFIGLRKGVGQEPSQVIHCCGDDSRYDPASGARVLAGPAPQPLAAVPLAWDAATDTLRAQGVVGGDRFDEFFAKYAFRLEMERGPQARARAAATTVVLPARRYSRQWQSCPA